MMMALYIDPDSSCYWSDGFGTFKHPCTVIRQHASLILGSRFERTVSFAQRYTLSYFHLVACEMSWSYYCGVLQLWIVLQCLLGTCMVDCSPWLSLRRGRCANLSFDTELSDSIVEDWTISFHSFRIKRATFVKFCLLRPFSQEIAAQSYQLISLICQGVYNSCPCNGHVLRYDAGIVWLSLVEWLVYRFWFTVHQYCSILRHTCQTPGHYCFRCYICSSYKLAHLACFS